MPARHQPVKSKNQQRWVLVLLLGVVVLGGIVSFFLAGNKDKEAKEDIVIVDLSTPPPPPPPPPIEPEPEMQPPEEEIPESSEISDADTPDDLSGDSTEEIDLGLDVGDFASGPGGAFTIDIPKFGKRGKSGEDPFGEEMDTPPTPVNRMPPQYPRSLLQTGVEGKVVLTCVVDAKGQLVSSTVKSSSGQPLLDRAALEAVKRWKFKAATRAGKPFQATCNIPFNFQIKR